ncbi:MAG: DUF86 domain-containing protein [Gammaproteobacteria bacterium]|nr:MAG: DUF86 domain-containing protein [Gammaproteobacteria bacterium]
MQPNDKDAAYIWDMREAAKKVAKFTADVDLSEFIENDQIHYAVERCLEMIGEAARRVSSEFQEKHPEIPWREIIGQRNILAHEYGEIDYEILYRTAKEDIPALIDILGELLPPLEE